MSDNPVVDPTTGAVLAIVSVVAVLAAGWFAIKGLARRDVSWALRLYRRIDPVVQAGRIWCARSPVTFVYVATWTVTTILIQGSPEEIATLFARFTSTNLYGVATAPLRVLVGSAFLVADNGLGYVAYVIVFALLVARAEQRLGSARIIVVGALAHALASLLIVAVEAYALRQDRVGDSIVLTIDVGVSYVMAGVCTGYLMFVSSKWRWWYAAALVATLVIPLVVIRDIWSLGHFLAAVIGLAATVVLARWGTRPPLLWRDLVADHPPRPLPTWQ